MGKRDSNKFKVNMRSPSCRVSYGVAGAGGRKRSVWVTEAPEDAGQPVAQDTDSAGGDVTHRWPLVTGERGRHHGRSTRADRAMSGEDDGHDMASTRVGAGASGPVGTHAEASRVCTGRNPQAQRDGCPLPGPAVGDAVAGGRLFPTSRRCFHTAAPRRLDPPLAAHSARPEGHLLSPSWSCSPRASGRSGRLPSPPLRVLFVVRALELSASLRFPPLHRVALRVCVSTPFCH